MSGCASDGNITIQIGQQIETVMTVIYY